MGFSRDFLKNLITIEKFEKHRTMLLIHDSYSQMRVLSCFHTRKWLPPHRNPQEPTILRTLGLLPLVPLTGIMARVPFAASEWFFCGIFLFYHQVPRCWILFLWKLTVFKLTIFRRTQATYLKTREVTAINIYRKLKAANSFILKPSSGLESFCFNEKGGKSKTILPAYFQI